MAGPPLPEDVPPDLMLPIGPIPDAAGRDVVLSGDQAEAVLAYCHAMGSRFGCPQYMRYFFGLPIDKALLSGYLTTQRALRETSPHACAQETARTARELVTRVHADGAQGWSVLDIFGGVGQMAYSYAQAGCRVEAIDNDRTTVDVAVSNHALAGLASVVEYHWSDGPETLAAAVDAGRRFSIIHLDPSWRGTYKYDLTQAFRLEDLGVHVEGLVRLGLEAGSVVVLNLPHNALSGEIREIADQVGCSVLIQYQQVADYPAAFGQAPAYFFKRSNGGRLPGLEHQELRRRLTVDGLRLD